MAARGTGLTWVPTGTVDVFKGVISDTPVGTNICLTGARVPAARAAGRWRILVPLTGIEPVAYPLGEGRSIRLSYRDRSPRG